MLPNLLIFGGTFDPVHMGHMNVAVNVQNHFHFDRFIFLPCKTPVLKNEAQATAKQRTTMLHLAIKDYPDLPFSVDTREIDRDTPSYMVNTLKSYRLELGEAFSITLLLGADAFKELPKWHQSEQLLSLCHLLVLKRPGILQEAQATSQKKDLKTQPYGKIYVYDAGEFHDTSTKIRQQLGSKGALSFAVPPAVLAYIQRYRLY